MGFRVGYDINDTRNDRCKGMAGFARLKLKTLASDLPSACRFLLQYAASRQTTLMTTGV